MDRARCPRPSVCRLRDGLDRAQRRRAVLECRGHPTSTQLLWSSTLRLRQRGAAHRHGHDRRPYRPPPPAARRRRTFAAASLLAALSTSVTMLIIARASLGVAGATLAPSTLSLIRALFEDARERTIAVDLARGFRLGGLLARLSGLVLAHFSWGAVFLPSIPVMVLLLAAVGASARIQVARRRSRGPTECRPVDRGRALVRVRFEAPRPEGWDETARATIIARLGLGYIFAVRQRHLGPATGPAPIQARRVRRRAGGEHDRVLRQLRIAAVPLSVPPGRPGPVADRRGALVGAVGRGLHPRLDADAEDR